MKRLESHDWWPEAVELKDDLSLRELGERFGCTPGALMNAFARQGLERRHAPPGPRKHRKKNRVIETSDGGTVVVQKSRTSPGPTELRIVSEWAEGQVICYGPIRDGRPPIGVYRDGGLHYYSYRPKSDDRPKSDEWIHGGSRHGDGNASDFRKPTTPIEVLLSRHLEAWLERVRLLKQLERLDQDLAALSRSIFLIREEDEPAPEKAAV